MFLFVLLSGILLNGIVMAEEAQYEKVGSEYRILSESIYPKMLDRPIPVGAVDVNPPWLAYNPWINEPEALSKPEGLSNRERRGFNLERKLKRKYYFELSQDKAFSVDVIKSGPKSWSFFNPYKKLSKGNWYWRVSFVDNIKQSPTFTNPIHSFFISGNERVFTPPSADEMVAFIKKNKSPRVIMSGELVGKVWNILSETERQDFTKTVEAAENLEILPFDKSINIKPEGRSERVILKLKSKLANSVIIKYTSAIDTLTRAYLMRGEEKYKTLAIDKYIKLHGIFPSVQIYYPKKGYISTFGGGRYLSTTVLLLDAFSDDLEPKLRKDMVDYCVARMTNGSDNYDVQLARSEYKVYDAHLWQGGVHKPMANAIVLGAYSDDAARWFKYFYELWLFRSPAGSRNDGGWHAGLGYFGVNEGQLLKSAWVLYQLFLVSSGSLR